MKINFEYKNTKDFVYVWIGSEKLQISNFMIFEYKDFHQRYPYRECSEKLKEDMVDTVMDIMSTPFSKEELMKNLNIGIHSDLFKYAKPEHES